MHGDDGAAPTADQWQEIVTVARDRAERAISLPGYTLTETGLQAHSPTLADALATGTILAKAHNVTLWAIGEWAIDAQARFGASYEQLVAGTGLSSSTIGKAIWLTRTFGKAERRPSLSPSHHEAAAPLSAPERATILDRAEREGMTRGEVRAIVRSPIRNADGERDLSAAYVTVIVADVRGAAWSLASAFGAALPALIAELRALAEGREGDHGSAG